MLFQSSTPDTSAYMIAGYLVFVVIMAIYLGSLIIRRRNLYQDLRTLEVIGAESKATESRSVPRGRIAAKAEIPEPRLSKRRQAGKRITRKK